MRDDRQNQTDTMRTTPLGFRHRPAAVLVFFILLLLASVSHSQQRELPSIGGLGGGLLSDQLERNIGQQVMSSLRRSAAQVHDPLINDYLASIVYRLVPHAPMNSRELTLVVIDSPQINAFAVPGNIVGVNGGLFLHADSEQQFGSVIAHELAHLSQRHFARRLEQQERSAPLTAAGLIAGILITAMTGSEAGIAAIAGTQALSIQNMLTYSRAHEQEADRVGLEIMANAGLDPRGMPEMFEIMMRQSRMQGNRIPEYLSTHPLTQNRVSDTRSRAEQYRRRQVDDTLEYHLMRTRLQVHYARSLGEATAMLEAYIEEPKAIRKDAARYGLAVAYLAASRNQEAEQILAGLLDNHPDRITYQVTRAEALVAMDRLSDARELMQRALRRNPGNYPITEMLATIELADDNGARAADYLRTLTRDHSYRENLWLRLAEAEGKARNIVGVHQARAEYDILMGDLESAQRQLRQAQERVRPEAPLRQIISERLAEVNRMQAERR